MKKMLIAAALALSLWPMAGQAQQTDLVTIRTTIQSTDNGTIVYNEKTWPFDPKSVAITGIGGMAITDIALLRCPCLADIDFVRNSNDELTMKAIRVLLEYRLNGRGQLVPARWEPELNEYAHQQQEMIDAAP
jgi:hypothetical protein